MADPLAVPLSRLFVVCGKVVEVRRGGVRGQGSAARRGNRRARLRSHATRRPRPQEDALRVAFEEYGQVQHVKVVKDKGGGLRGGGSGGQAGLDLGRSRRLAGLARSGRRGRIHDFDPGLAGTPKGGGPRRGPDLCVERCVPPSPRPSRRPTRPLALDSAPEQSPTSSSTGPRRQRWPWRRSTARS